MHAGKSCYEHAYKTLTLTTGSKSGLDKLTVRFLINNKTCKTPKGIIYTENIEINRKIRVHSKLMFTGSMDIFLYYFENSTNILMLFTSTYTSQQMETLEI